jgi:5-methylcytosine-specific restriction endonuclease McrA
MEFRFKKGNKINLGRIPSAETRKKMSMARTGFKHSTKSKQKISASQIGHPNYNTGKTWFKNGNKLFLGRKHSKEALNKMRLAKEKKPVPWVTGENNWNWKGGITPIKKKLRESIKYKYWRKQVFERDSYTCQVCGKVGGKLHPHHECPFEFAEIINYLIRNYGTENIYDKALGFELLWNPLIAKTYCVDCHKQTDNYLKPLI